MYASTHPEASAFCACHLMRTQGGCHPASMCLVHLQVSQQVQRQLLIQQQMMRSTLQPLTLAQKTPSQSCLKHRQLSPRTAQQEGTGWACWVLHMGTASQKTATQNHQTRALVPHPCHSFDDGVEHVEHMASWKVACSRQLRSVVGCKRKALLCCLNVALQWACCKPPPTRCTFPHPHAPLTKQPLTLYDQV